MMKVYALHNSDIMNSGALPSKLVRGDIVLITEKTMAIPFAWSEEYGDLIKDGVPPGEYKVVCRRHWRAGYHIVTPV